MTDSTSPPSFERLEAADVANLGGGISHLVIGLCRLATREDGSVPSFEELRELVNERLGRSPRFRQFPYSPDGASGQPVWADDQDFDLDDHVILEPSDAPADRHRLDELLADWMTTPIDESKPLWIVKYVPTDDGVALLVKSSHALADGLGSIALFAMLLFDVTVEPQRDEPSAWVPTPLPAAKDLGESDTADETGGNNFVERATSMLTNPSQLREAATSSAAIGTYLLRKSREQMPTSPIASGSGAPLELRTLEYPLDRLKLLGRGLGTGATMNDVILGLVAGGLRQWLIENGEPLEDVAVRVPVAMKKVREEGDGGNPGVAPMIVPLPVAVEDPVRRVRLVRERTESIKAAGEPGYNLAVRKLVQGAPSAVRDRALPLITGNGQANVAIHNLPGPPIKLFVLGAPTTSFHSFTLPRAGLALHVNVVSVGGVVSIGLAGDVSVMKSLDSFVRGFDETEKALAGGVGKLDLVRRVPVFSPLDDDVQEDLASRMSEREVKSGEAITTQGEQGDEFFLIVEGTFEASADGTRLREMTAGDSFGEIALLRETERTATVTATSDSLVMVLSRDAFLEAVAADPTSMVVADAIISTRLGDLGRYKVLGDGER
ncbi:MAG: cyclic nucleotide-binding domain-containing protein [Solirubrobacteraceae bacterium]|jgi:diacylglycerol O-acyltransferase / wax synthase|nr:cyclic nucleotide-binding domain-containing protein [Solirubrobacteraceae bacterium]MDP4673622.1 cyclic nucleotide-binding domain-containing protein [Solirubrobacteraceae bacterium]MDP4920727.1 cyclic nucleotide-binding domain-containing protein [Solirubrobacteraceae bacterium]